MIDELKQQMEAKGWKGHVYTRVENMADLPKAIQAVFEIDEDYQYVVSIDNGFKAPADIPEISFAGSDTEIQTNLDEAIMEGLAHSKMLKEKETGAIIRFGYTSHDIFGK
ncbi:MAG: hypothetical protein MJY47_08035 [Fibrobacter sp.]|nr:hypothetical protein [Fibrobacter sp.]